MTNEASSQTPSLADGAWPCPANFFPAMSTFVRLQRQRAEVEALEASSLAALREAAVQLARAVETRERLDRSIRELLKSS